MTRYRKSAVAAVSLLGAVAIGLNGWPAAARMGTAEIRKEGSTLIIVGGSAANDITVSSTDPGFWTDTSGVTGRTGCTQVNDTQVSCGSYGTVRAELGDEAGGNS